MSSEDASTAFSGFLGAFPTVPKFTHLPEDTPLNKVTAAQLSREISTNHEAWHEYTTAVTGHNAKVRQYSGYLGGTKPYLAEQLVFKDFVRTNGLNKAGRTALTMIDKQIAATNPIVQRKEKEKAEAFAEVTKLKDELQVLKDELQQLQARLAGNPTPVERLVNFPEPARFAGESGELETFLTNLKWKFAFDADKFVSERHKLAYAIAHTIGGVRKLLHEHFVCPNGEISALSNLEDFYNLMERFYS